MKVEYISTKGSAENNLLSALSAATKEIQSRSYQTDTDGPRGMYSYMSLPELLANLIPVLHKNGISLNSFVSYVNELINVKLQFSDGTVSLSETMVFPPQLTPAEIMENTRKDKNGNKNPVAVIHYTGSLRTYFTRYALLSFFCIHPAEDADGYNFYHQGDDEVVRKEVDTTPKHISGKDYVSDEPVKPSKVKEKRLEKKMEKRQVSKPKVEKPKVEKPNDEVDYKQRFWEMLQEFDVAPKDAKRIVAILKAKFGIKTTISNNDWKALCEIVKPKDIESAVSGEREEEENSPKPAKSGGSFISRASANREKAAAEKLGDSVGYSEPKDEVDESSSFNNGDNDMGEFAHLFKGDDTEAF